VVQAREIPGPPVGGLPEALAGARVHLTDVGGRLEGTAMPQALEPTHPGDARELGVLPAGPLVVAEALPAVVPLRSADGGALVDPATGAEVTDPAAVEAGARGVGTGKPSQVSGPRGGAGRAEGLAGQEQSPRSRRAFPA
jgi:hypothetical protein